MENNDDICEAIPLIAAMSINKPVLIGLLGAAGAGKDTIASVLTEYFGFEKIAFADPVYKFAEKLNPWLMIGGISIKLNDLVRNIGWEVAKRQHQEVRSLIQTLGTECGRNVISEDIWVDTWNENYTRRAGKHVIVPDVRFANEWARLKVYGGEVWKIVNPNNVGIGVQHASEQLWNTLPYDVQIDNSGTLLDLRAKVIVELKAAINYGLRYDDAPVSN